jgi:hypothetical protein
MFYFLAGSALLVLLLVGARFLSAVDPRRLASLLRKSGGIAALVIAFFLLIRGALILALPLGTFGLVLLGFKRGRGLGGVFGSATRTPGQKSQVRTEWLEMELDHDSGHMDGKCLKGRFAGRTLSSLSDMDALDLLNDFEADGVQEAALIEAYLDWRKPGWRDQQSTEEGQAKGFAEEGRTARPRHGPRASRMSVEEARDMLGIDKTASEAEIRQAHRRLMMKLHPDQGGTNYLAARINEAKEVLLGRK